MRFCVNADLSPHLHFFLLNQRQQSLTPTATSCPENEGLLLPLVVRVRNMKEIQEGDGFVFYPNMFLFRK